MRAHRLRLVAAVLGVWLGCAAPARAADLPVSHCSPPADLG